MYMNKHTHNHIIDIRPRPARGRASPPPPAQRRPPADCRAGPCKREACVHAVCSDSI